MAAVYRRVLGPTVVRLRSTRLARALTRYSTANGPLLAGGIAYTGLFSAFAVLTLGATTLMAVLAHRPAWRDAVVRGVNGAVPGLIDTGDGTGVLSLQSLTWGSALTWGSVLAAIALLYSATGLMRAVSAALRVVFGLVYNPRHPVVTQAWNLVAFLGVAVGVAATTVASVATTRLPASLGARLELPAWATNWGGWLLGVGSSFLIDAAVLAVLVLCAGVRPPWRDLVEGAALGSVLFGVIRQVGVGVVARSADNPLLASFVTLEILVLWLHLMGRVVLLTGAWIANPPRPQAVASPQEVHAHERPNYVTLSAPATLRWPHQGLTGSVGVDRAVLAPQGGATGEAGQRAR